jgi:hypothetical protein
LRVQLEQPGVLLLRSPSRLRVYLFLTMTVNAVRICLKNTCMR